MGCATWFVAATLLCSPPPFQAVFHDATLAVHLAHGGDRETEFFIPAGGAVWSGWAGPRAGPVPRTSPGSYRWELRDAATARLLAARHFDLVFGEWRRTPAARHGRRIFRETLLLPRPRRPAVLRLLGRDRRGSWVERACFNLEAFAPFARIARPLVTPEVLRPGGPPPARALDLVFLAEGYPVEDLARFRERARALAAALGELPPFALLRKHLRVRLLPLPSSEAGIDEPDRDRWVRTALETRYGVFGMAKYILVTEEERLADVLAGVPCDLPVILVNSRRYGGGGVYGRFVVVAAEHPAAREVFLHELGHALAGLGDEYYLSSVTYEAFYPPDVEPWAPNLTRLLPSAGLKWRSFVTEGTPVPTPWPAATYARLLKAGADRQALRKFFAALGGTERVGAYEGAGYEPKGMYRPAPTCLMFSLAAPGFCPVCRAALRRAVREYTRP